MFTSYIKGFKSTFGSKKMVTLIYLSTLFLGLLIVIPFFGMLKSNITSSMLSQELLKNFDFTAYSEITHSLNKAISPFISMIKCFGIGYFFFSILLSGGIISVLNNEKVKYSIKNFFLGCAENFWRFFRVTLYTLVIQLVFLVIFLIPAVIIVTNLYDTVQSESTLVYVSVAFLITYLSVFAFFICVADYAKIRLVKDDSREVLKVGWKSLKFVAKNITSYFLYIMTLIFPIILTLGYLFLDSSIGMSSGATIFLMLVIQQAVVWSRVFGKVWIIGAEIEFYKLKNPTKIKVDEDNHQFELEEIITSEKILVE